MKLPKAKSENIVVQDLGKELLVYNLTTHRAYTLNETSKIVFNACNGTANFADLKRKHRFTDDLIYLALDELKANNLLEDYQSSHFSGLSRREAIKKVGLASMLALPVVSMLVAPKAIRAASGIAEDVCVEVECPYAQDGCHFDGVCENQGGEPVCIEPVRPDGTICDDGNISTGGNDICLSGKCVGCPSGLTNCSGGADLTAARCKNLQTDPQNCGECGNNCGGGNCVGGICQPVG